jgi:2-isopropylmalate synthase
MGFSRFLSEIANVYHDHRQPFVGESAFAHKGGAHIDGVMKVAHSFEHVAPEAIGNERRFLVSDQSGGATIVNKLRRFLPDISKSDPLVATVLERVKVLENQGYQFEAAEGSFELLSRRVQGLYEDKFSLVHFRTINRRGVEEIEDAEAIVKVKIDGQVFHTVGSGDGPVNALDRALRKALENEFPAVRSVHLEDYKVRVLSSSDGTAAKVRVLIESSDGHDSWGTVGVSENVIDASWLALADSLHYKLMKDSIKNE